MKDSVIDEVSLVLLRQGFTIKAGKSPFDILARKNDRILLIKVLEDAGAVTVEMVGEMNKLASIVQASPLMVSERSSRVLDENVIYSRHDMDTVNVKTLKNVLQGKPVFLRSKKAGVSAHINGGRLRKVREREGLSIGSLARRLGVSSKMIVRYEHGDAEVSVQHAQKLYESLDGSVFEQVDILSSKSGREVFASSSPIVQKYNDLGFIPAEIKRQPFDVVARKENEIILTHVGDNVPKELGQFSHVLGSDNLVIFKNKRPKDMPALKKDEFLDFEMASELIKFVKEFE